MSELPPSPIFPPAENADEDGLLAMGGCLDPEWLIDAYAHGIFPWPVGDDSYPMTWFSPDPRAVIEFGSVHISKRLRRTLRAGTFDVTCNQCFEQVMTNCGEAKGREGETWITPAMLEAYVRLHEMGFAHSVEAWHEGRLVGGVYGVAVRGLFAAESMYFTVANASKVALAHLLRHVASRGFTLFDIQMVTPITESCGASEIPREDYLQRLAAALQRDVSFGEEMTNNAW